MPDSKLEPLDSDDMVAIFATPNSKFECIPPQFGLALPCAICRFKSLSPNDNPCKKCAHNCCSETEAV